MNNNFTGSIKYFPDEESAMNELRRRKSSKEYEGMLSRITSSPYGGFTVTSLPVDLVVDDLIDSKRLGIADKLFSGASRYSG